MTEKDVIEQELAKLSQPGVLGRSRSYIRLLEYLAVCSVNERTPKELEIASEVFGKGSDFDPNQDSLVRVYVHNLRQKLDTYYAQDDGSQRLVIPKGEYRLSVVSADETSVQVVPANRAPPVWIAVLVAALCLNLVALLWFGRGGPVNTNIYDEVASSAIWDSFLDDDLPFLIAVGDYYIFGELDQFGNVARLVRDFEINSADDLDDQFVYEPELMESYLDLDLTYLPDASASALKDVLRIVYRSDKPVRITPMSELNVADLRNSHIIYIGYISALDKLMEFVFASSGLQLGDTYDELFETQSGRTYTSGAGIPRADRPNYRDYGFFSTFPGPSGNQVMIVSGTRDEGMMNTAQAVTLLPSITELHDRFPDLTTDDEPALEALYEVTGFDRMNLDAVLVYEAELDYEAIWRGALP
jgi:hypothetical protein